MRILLVDDCEDILEVFRIALDKTHEVYGCSRVTVALETIEKSNFRFDLIISDLEMPGLDGLEFYNRVRSVTESNPPPFWFFTGRPEGVAAFVKNARERYGDDVRCFSKVGDFKFLIKKLRDFNETM